MKGYAAKYSNGILTDLADITPTTTGQSTVLLQFEPDKVFIWNDMTPVDFLAKNRIIKSKGVAICNTFLIYKYILIINNFLSHINKSLLIKR